MVKRCLYSLLFILFAITVKGQDNKFKPEWNVGIGFGPTFSSMSFETGINVNSLSTKNLQQYAGGIAIRYITEKNLGLIAELNYSQQGWAQNFKEEPQYAHSHKLDYFEIPVLTHIYFGNKVRFIFNLGPKLSFLLSDSEEINEALENYLASGTFPEYRPSYQYYHMAERKIDYGIMAGMGIEIRTGIGSFALEGRYSFGLGDIYNNSKADYFTRSANRVISAKLTYYVKLF
ncbi:porin family protein [Dysgonomonas sp. Marseille-P4361]|uniref:porin family protein n=1 Tax=Dysgonomonas sp. Marseille-P4361 TaxID=2161820 RepID=UPI000D54DA5B|nr:porin family protein [Dysgonomonas sp. Marseille-P4361]